MDDETKKRILQEVIELTKPPECPQDAITSLEYAEELGITRRQAIYLLGKGVKEGKLEMIDYNDLCYWRPKS